MIILLKKVKTLDKKKEYKRRDCDDLDYYKIRDINNKKICLIMILIMMMIITSQY